MKKIDLHLHTTASDGTLSPKEIVDYAIKKDMKAIAITDHDSIAGVKEALEYSKDKKLIVVPGVEMGCDNSEFGDYEIHIVGLFIDYNNKELNKFLKQVENWSEEQKAQIIEKLNKLGYEISLEEIRKKAKGIMGRPHIAQVLVEKYPEFKDIRQVFEELLGIGEKAYVRPKNYTIKQTINVIKKAGGIPILAHPGYLDKENKILNKFIQDGGKAIEIDSSYYTLKNKQEIIEKFQKIAKEKNLIVSGGSDFHGKVHPIELGEAGINDKEFGDLKRNWIVLKNKEN